MSVGRYYICMQLVGNQLYTYTNCPLTILIVIIIAISSIDENYKMSLVLNFFSLSVYVRYQLSEIYDYYFKSFTQLSKVFKVICLHDYGLQFIQLRVY